MTSLSRSRTLYFALAALLIGVYYAVGEVFLGGYQLSLGSHGFPRVRYITFLTFYQFFGLFIVILLTLGFARVFSRESVSAWLSRIWLESSDRAWLVFGMVLAFVLPLVLRTTLLHGAPLTDDESCYRYASMLLAEGKLYGASPPMKLFFDRAFAINDGKYFTQFFLGWPALRAIGVWFGAGALMNPLLNALFVPAFYAVVRRIAGARWARLGLLVFLSSPMLLVCAATELSHTSCLSALAWTLWCFFRTRDDDAPLWSHAAFAFCFSLAFFIRPTTALGIGLPMLLLWAVARLKQGIQTQTRSIAAFLAPAVLMASLFLLVNKAQSGSFTTVAYQRYLSYSIENRFRFSNWRSLPKGKIHTFSFKSPSHALANTGIGFYRLFFALSGWCFAIFLFAGFRRHAWLLWLCFASFFLIHLFLEDAGIDSFGPLHYTELALPILILSLLALRLFTQLLEPLERLWLQAKDAAAASEQKAEKVAAATTSEEPEDAAASSEEESDVAAATESEEPEDAASSSKTSEARHDSERASHTHSDRPPAKARVSVVEHNGGVRGWAGTPVAPHPRPPEAEERPPEAAATEANKPEDAAAALVWGLGFAPRWLPLALLVSLVVVAWVGYVPTRWQALSWIAELNSQPLQKAAALEHKAVVFVPGSFVQQCRRPLFSWMFWWPVNDPHLRNKVLWANHITLAKNKLLLRKHFPKRKGYVLLWSRDCEAHLRPLESFLPGQLPDAKLVAPGKRRRR